MDNQAINSKGWPTEGPERMRCLVCKELHTAWVLVECQDRKTGLVTFRECRFCQYGVEVWVEYGGYEVTRAEDKADAESL